MLKEVTEQCKGHYVYSRKNRHINRLLIISFFKEKHNLDPHEVFEMNVEEAYRNYRQEKSREKQTL